ncbi:isoprenyl transferase [uncultured Propionibacterium sp.]|uniref:isoprenyl transferase n=1 Tax=uncultured Propionibacterium sp. TaxID=218066 RepID=UPI002930C7BB|nr:isoprenyl transferase [uncultured Propionibacterium sp.]
MNASSSRPVRPPDPHPSGARAPRIPAELVPHHVAIVMDGNGRWARARGMARTKGHEVGEKVLIEVLQGAIEMGIGTLSMYAFSTENWRRSPDEVRFLMGFSRRMIHTHRDFMDDLGVRVIWSGRRPKLWASVLHELQAAEEQTRGNTTINLQLCLNYGGRAEIADAMAVMGRDVRAGRLNPDRIGEKTVQRYLYHPGLGDVDLFIRTSGEQRTSNFLLWQSAYAELLFSDKLWPDWDRRDLWAAVEQYARRDRRFGGAQA